MSINNRRGLLSLSGLILLGSGSSIPFITNPNLFTNIFSAQGGGSSLTSYFKIGNRNQKDLYLNNYHLRPEKALEEVKILESSNLNLNIDKPDLKIKDFVGSKNEKQNIEKIYKEIDREGKVLVIDRKKDQEFQRLKNGLESHESDFSEFIQSVPKIIKKIKKQELKRTKRQTKENEGVQLVRRIKRFSKEPITENEKKERDDFIKVLDQIKAKDINNKQAVWEFYKSYLLALREEESLFEQLKKVDDENTIKNLKRKKRDMEGIEKNLIYLAKKGWRNTPINLGEEGKWDDKDNTLLSKQLINPLKNEWESIQKEIDEIENSSKLQLCQLTSIATTLLSAAAWGGKEGCLNKIKWMKSNQQTLQRAIEFQLLVKLLKDMKQSKTSFEITYEKN